MKTVTRENIDRKLGSVEVAERNEAAAVDKVNSGMDVLKQIPLGQPKIIGRPDIYKKPLATIDSGMRAYNEWNETAENRRELHEKVSSAFDSGVVDVAVSGKTAYASVGAKTSVNNLEYFKKELAELEAASEKAKQTNKENRAKIKGMTAGEIRAAGLAHLMSGWYFDRLADDEIPAAHVMVKHVADSAKIRDRKTKIEHLERMKAIDENSGENKALQEFINDGTLNQWQKQPIYYFVNGMRKTAIIKTEQGFGIAAKYPPSTDNKETVQAIVDKLNAEGV